MQFLNPNIKEIYPECLLESRDIIEANVMVLLWKNIMLLDDFPELKQDNSFLTIDGQIISRLLFGIRESGYKSIDAVSLELYLQGKDELKKLLNERQIIKTLNSASLVINEENAEKYIDELNKFNTLNSLHLMGFNVEKDIDKFKSMTSTEIYDYLDFVLTNTFIKRNRDTEISDFKVGIEEHIREADKGLGMGFSYASSLPLLNYITSGVTDGFHIVAGLSGVGKTSFVISTYLLPLIEKGHNIVLICNEQNKSEWWNMVITTILSAKFDYFNISRKKFITGHFTDEQKIYIQKAIDWLRDQSGRICFVKMFNYNLSETKMVLKKYSKLGYDTVIYDTFKADTADTSSNNPLWQTLLHSSKELFQVTSKEGMRLIATVQIAQRFANTRYLNNSCLSGSTQMIEVASTCILLRHAWDDELDPSSKFYIKPYNYIKGENGNYTNAKEFVDTGFIKKGMVVFISKNRAGDSDIEVLLNNQAYVNKFSEVGYCHVCRTQY